MRRFTSQPDTDDAVRARKSLLGLLMQLCQNLSKEGARGLGLWTDGIV